MLYAPFGTILLSHYDSIRVGAHSKLSECNYSGIVHNSLIHCDHNMMPKSSAIPHGLHSCHSDRVGRAATERIPLCGRPFALSHGTLAIVSPRTVQSSKLLRNRKLFQGQSRGRFSTLRPPHSAHTSARRRLHRGQAAIETLTPPLSMRGGLGIDMLE